MVLTAYIAATNRLLQNPVPAANPLYTVPDLTVYINEARQQLAAEAECIRATSTANLGISISNYQFGLFTGFSSGGGSLTGVASALTIRQMSVTVSAGVLRLMTYRPYAWFNRFYISTGAAQAAGTPGIWTQQGRGSKGTFTVTPIPNAALALQVDVACLPVDLVDNATPEAIPDPFTAAIPFYAAYKAYLSSQRRDDASVMLGRYKDYVAWAIQENTPTVLPGLQPGGVGAQVASSKTALTGRPAGGQRGQQ